MAKQQLKDFLREKTERSTASGIDWISKRDAWIKAVERLYETIATDYLDFAAVGDAIAVDRSRMKPVREMYVGDYRIPEMTVTVGDEQVVFTPMGLNVVGAQGRVDVQGERGEASLVLHDEHQWSLVISRTPKLQLVPLNEDSFLELLRSVMR
jgi:hypothetical protein